MLEKIVGFERERERGRVHFEFKGFFTNSLSRRARFAVRTSANRITLSSNADSKTERDFQL